MKNLEKNTYTYRGATVTVNRADSMLYRAQVIADGKAKVYWLNEAHKYQNGCWLARYFISLHLDGQRDEALLEKALLKEQKPELHTQAGFKAWLQEHIFEAVGSYGGRFGSSNDTPLNRYIRETQDQWTKTPFEWDGCMQNRPRWMDRLQHYFEEQHAGEVRGGNVLADMGRDSWNTSHYDLHNHLSRF